MKLKDLIKQEKGITLIALVITIIVLLILAAVSIATLTGQNGILTKASESKTKTDRAGAKEKVQIEVAGSMGTDLTVDMDLLKDNLKKNLGLTDGDITENDDGSITIPVDGYTFTVSPNGKITDNGEIPKEPEKIEGSSSVWQVNEEGDTIIKYIGGEFEGDTVVIPNYVDGKKIIALGSGIPIFVSPYNTYIQQKKLKIPEGIEELNNNVFSSCSGFIGKLKIPNTVTKIGRTAFSNCTGFTGDLNISSSVASLGESVFYGCSGLNGTLSIGMKDTNPENNSNVNYFNGTNFNKLILKDTVEKIGAYTFSAVGFNKSELVLPKNIKEIGANAFSNCYFTGNLIIPDSLTTIGNGAFSSNSFTGDLKIPGTVKNFGTGVFYDTNTFSGTLTLGIEEVKKMFNGLPKFTTLILENTVKKIGSNNFLRMERPNRRVNNSKKCYNNRSHGISRMYRINWYYYTE